MRIQKQFPALLLAVCAAVGWGQATNSADVTGTVTDSSGAVIPGAKVAIKDLDKGTERDLTSNGAGLYDSGPIVPNDRYTVTFSRQGFGSLQRGPMVLEVGVTGLNVQLAVGTATQQVVVNENAPLLETTSAELSTTIPTDTLQTLPQTGTPDWQYYVVLQPGVSGNNNDFSNPEMGDSAANGSMPFSTAMLDGSTISSPMSDDVINTPVFDSIGEVQMSDSDFSAQYGTGGIIYNMITKSGSNTFHGMVYDYMQNTVFNAASYEFGAGKPPAVIHYNDWGFQVGGPAIKNKIFLFLDWDRRINHGAGALDYTTLPTTAMTSGDFTAAGLPVLYDPTTQTVNPTTGAVTRQTFISEYGSNKIPTGLLDSVSQKIAAIFPALPSTTAFATNNYSYRVPASISDEQKWVGRFDTDLTSKDHFYGSTAYNYPDPILPGASIVAPINQLVVDVENYSAQVSEVHTFSASTINEARSGWMAEYDLLTSPTLNQGWPAKLGMQYSEANIFPTINISGIYGLSPELHANYRENTFDESDVVTMIRGRHSLHLGGEIDAYRADSTAWGNINSGTFGFTGVYTAGPTPSSPVTGTGAPYADFLLGYVNSWSASVTPDWYGRLKDSALFVQDDWKLSPKLTLNLGLRWEGRTGWSDPTNNERSFDTTITNPATGAGGGEWYAATHTNGRTRLEQNKWNNWLPRFGAAYQLGTKMTLRGGFGMYTFPWNTDNYAANNMNAYGASGSESDSTGNNEPVAFMDGTGNENPQGAKGSSVKSLYVTSPTTPQAYNGSIDWYMQYDQAIPLLYNWNVTVQRQLSGSMMAQIGYVGSHAINLLFNKDLDQVAASNLVANVNNFALRPYPEYLGIPGNTTQATSVYNSFQALFARRLSKGLMVNANYTWSHMTDDQDSSGWGNNTGVSVFQNSYVPKANWGASNYDVRQMFKAYGSYELPFGTGRKYLNNSKALDEGLGGWTMSLTLVTQGGNPFTPVELVNDSYATATGVTDFAWYPNQVGNAHSGHYQGTKSWFNVNAFAEPTPGTFGNNHRNDLYGPGLHVINGSLHKTFQIWERVNFDFAVNATNLINHPSFAEPDANIGYLQNAQITAVSEGGRTVDFVGKIRW